ncbi:MAG: hypothetical protein PSX71_10285 [bacterium]|nr:hypothetical protein [bacterium]
MLRSVAAHQRRAICTLFFPQNCRAEQETMALAPVSRTGTSLAKALAGMKYAERVLSSTRWKQRSNPRRQSLPKALLCLLTRLLPPELCHVVQMVSFIQCA